MSVEAEDQVPDDSFSFGELERVMSQNDESPSLITVILQRKPTAENAINRQGICFLRCKLNMT